MSVRSPYLSEFLGFDPVRQVLRAASTPTGYEERDGDIFVALALISPAQPGPDPVPAVLRLRAYGQNILRLTLAPTEAALAGDSPMMQWASDLRPEPLAVTRDGEATAIRDARGAVRARFGPQPRPGETWSRLLPAPPELLHATFFPGGGAGLDLTAHDAFFPGENASLGLLAVSDAATGRWERAGFSFQAEANERFAGTGERFARLDLAGRTLTLWNEDALGVNNRRAYKNVPFYVSSRPYGLFIHTSARLRLSLADVSTRAAQGVVEDDQLDLFLIGGESLEEIVGGYRRITGFPATPPTWSFGMWMSRMTYFSAEEVTGVARRLREGKFPCDVLHLDTGWFAKDWVCEWKFSPERFPDPAGFMRAMRKMGLRISLWQTPNLGEGNALLATARERRYVPPLLPGGPAVADSDLSGPGAGTQIDFTNPEAVAWYQGLLRNLFELGASAIKVDFGESVRPDADFLGMPAAKLHNLYALLYQRAAAEATRAATGEAIIWARAGWAGCQRYPVHWGGDCACTWDGLVGSLRGGLHLGLSGFGYWSHDVPGFHGLPDFMNSRPSDTLYVRWTQFGVFTSHLRYHGTSAREPYAYPAVTGIVREWLKLRYALVPYLEREARAVADSGFPILRALPFHDHRDPVCWAIDDEYLFGSAFLVAPVMNDAGRRDIYLPQGQWIDFWTGEVFAGPIWLRQREFPLGRMPVYARGGAEIPVYPWAVSCTDEMDPARTVPLRFDADYRGLASSPLGTLVAL